MTGADSFIQPQRLALLQLYTAVQSSVTTVSMGATAKRRTASRSVADRVTTGGGRRSRYEEDISYFAFVISHTFPHCVL